MIRRVDQIVSRVRAWTENEDASAGAGIPSDDFVDALSDGQEMLQGAILRSNPDCRWFDVVYDVALVAGQKEYSIPTRAFYANAVRKVEFSETGREDDFVPLDPVGLHQLSNLSTWPPACYSLTGRSVVLDPPPDVAQGTLRITYVARVPRLARPIGLISSFSSPSLILTSESTFLDATALSNSVPGYFSIIRRLDGAGISYSMTATAYDSGTRTLTVSAGPTYETGFVAADLVGAMLVAGDYATCAPAWPVGIEVQVERYLRNYGIWKIMRRESSGDTSEQGNELSAIEADIIKSANAAQGDYPVVVMDSDGW